jgi:S1-C subfamily serine protease
MVSLFPRVNAEKTAGIDGDIGMPLLQLSRSVTFDLPHGRLWFSKDLPIRDGFKSNHSGLKLTYGLNLGDRVLKVSKVDQKSPSQFLWLAGVRVGTVITQIDSIPAEDLDQWEVDLRLSGYFGETVTLEWSTKTGLKVAPIKVR